MRGWIGASEDDNDGDDIELGCMMIRFSPKEVVLPHAVSSKCQALS